MSQKQKRIEDMLSGAFGRAINGLLDDPDVVEILLNADGKLWSDTLSTGKVFTGKVIAEADAERIIRIVASQHGEICNAENPVVGGELPGSGNRFQGMLPPVAKRPVFSIRKRALKVFTLGDYVAQGIMTDGVAVFLKKAVSEKKNILVAGGTGSGKTTLSNALLDEMAKTGDRILILEDTVELQCNAQDHVCLRCVDGVDMTALLKATMRLRPDRIVVGEVRGGEALALIKAMNTGHPGSLSTVHANSARQALDRIEQLVQETAVLVPRALIADAINVIIYIQKEGIGRKIKQVVAVKGCTDKERYDFESIL